MGIWHIHLVWSSLCPKHDGSIVMDQREFTAKLSQAEFNLPKPPWICTSAECTEITQWKLNKNILPFSVLDNLISSKMGRDPSTGAWYCVDCHYESANKGDVGNHIEAKHVETAGTSCDICGIVTKTRKAMKMHKMRQHKPLHPYWLLCRLKYEIKL